MLTRYQAKRHNTKYAKQTKRISVHKNFLRKICTIEKKVLSLQPQNKKDEI